MTSPERIRESCREAVRIDLEERRKLRAQQELIRTQKEAAAYQRALDYYNRPRMVDFLKAPVRAMVKLLKGDK